MKIGNEQIRALQESEFRKKTETNPAAKGFESLLTQELGQTAEQGVPLLADARSAARQAELASVLAAATDGPTATAALSAADEKLSEASARMESMFAGMEQYAALLGSNDPASLKNAYSMLDGVSGEMSAFRSAFPEMESEHPEIAAMMNELNVLATTERFKFNRGDYL